MSQTPQQPPRASSTPSTDEAQELHNSEQDDEGSQAQTVADAARQGGRTDSSPLDSGKTHGDSEIMDDASQDLIDVMRDMEQSGRIDMGAFRGEPNMDDEDEAYGKKSSDED